jgi:hypothetical protein
LSLHEQSIGASDEWYTPAYVFEAMGARFDLDVAAPAGGCAWIPADRFISKGDDAMRTPWRGFVWMNPPFGGRNGVIPWLARFFEMDNGVALVPDRTSAPWWQEYAPQADALLFVKKKIRFLKPDGTTGNSPAQGTTLLAKGPLGVAALERAAAAGLGTLFHHVSVSEAA